MENFTYQNKTKLIFGRNDESVIAAELKNHGAKKVLVHYGQNSIIKSGLLGRTKDALNKAGIKYIEFGGVKANPLRSHALEGITLAKQEKVDFILAIGGGSVIDSAKCIAVGAVNSKVWDFYTGKKECIKALPVGVVLTIPAAGSENSRSTVIVDDKSGLKYSFGCEVLRPVFAVINPVICATLPKEQVAYGASDILAHLLERYFSPDPNIGLTDKILTGAIRQMFIVAPRAYADPTKYESMAEFCLIGTLAHNGMLALGRVNQDWGTHVIENKVLSGAHDVAHGAGLAVIFPAWLKHVAKTKPSKILQFANEVMDEKTIDKGIAKLEAFYKSLGLETTLGGLGIKLDEARKFACIAFNKDTVLGEYGQLSFDDILKILEIAK